MQFTNEHISNLNDMTKFAKWLDSHPGMQRKLAIALNTKESTVSNVKARRRPMPTWWMPTVSLISQGALTLENLIQEHRRKPR